MHEEACFKIDENMKRHDMKFFKNGSCMLYFVMKYKPGGTFFY